MTAGPTILHYDGAAWTRVDSGQTSLDLWWAFGFPGGDVLFTGSGGTILRYRAGAFERLTTPTTSATIFGLWGATPDDLWAVGNAGTNGGVVWHSSDGRTFTQVAIPGVAPRFVFKVHGQASNDVWMACDGGVTLHWDGQQLTSVPTPSTDSLFSIVTTPDLAIAVGGFDGVGQVLENDRSGWSESALPAPTWRGVAARDSDVVVVGVNGSVARRAGSSWTLLPQDLTNFNFHSVWIDEDHGVWLAGGLFDGLLSDGMLLYYGVRSITEVSP